MKLLKGMVCIICIDHCESLSIQGAKGTSEKDTAAIRITAQGSRHGDGATESRRSRWDLRLIQLYIFI